MGPHPLEAGQVSRQVCSAARISACRRESLIPTRPAACSMIAAMAANNRGSASSLASVRTKSFSTGIHHAHVAGFPAIRAVEKPVNTKTNSLLRLAIATILFATALPFRLVALRTQDGTAHRVPFARVSGAIWSEY